MVLDTATDDFYKTNMYNNYGEVGLSVKELVDKFSQASEQHKQVRHTGSIATYLALADARKLGQLQVALFLMVWSLRLHAWRVHVV